MGLEPANHLAGAGLEPNYLPTFVVGGELSAEGVELGGIHHVDVELAVDIVAEEELSAVGGGEVGVQGFVDIGAELLIDEGGLAGLDGGANLSDIAGLIIRAIAVLGGCETKVIFDHDFDKVAMVAPVGAVVEGIGRAFVGGVEAIGKGHFIDLLFHGGYLLDFFYCSHYKPYSRESKVTKSHNSKFF